MKNKAWVFVVLGVFCSVITFADGPLGHWQFPRNHGIHPSFNVEWWYLTGHITDTDQKKHGVQVTFFRYKVQSVSGNRSLFNSDQLYVAHAAWTDINKKEFSHDERVGRPGLTKLIAEKRQMNLQIQDWRLYQKGERFIIDIPASFGHLKLDLVPAKAKIFHGKNGKSFKGPHPDQFSYYYSYTRLKGNASLATAKKKIQSDQVSLWMDREIFDQSVNDTQQGWDWFAIQCDDNMELMCFQVRGKTPETDFRAGTLVATNGETVSLKMSDISFTILDDWKSKKTGITYPLKWQIKIPKYGVDLIVDRTINNQELSVSTPLPMSYWEGSCRVTGTHAGNAYMELVGYERYQKGAK
ncbi:MAG: lipocalin-like domain-containing protein [bacterium]